MIQPGSPFRGYRGRAAHIADGASEWHPRIASLCGQWHPRSGKFAAVPAPDVPACARCAKVAAARGPVTYRNPFVGGG